MKMIADLENLPTKELKQALASMQEELRKRSEADRRKKALDLEKAAMELGFSSLNDAARAISAGHASHKDGGEIVNPEDPSQVWSGRGRKPRWLHEQIRRGEENKNKKPSGGADRT